MKWFHRLPILQLLIALLYQNSVSGQQSQWNWARQLNGPSNEEEIDAVASDAQGNVFISGKFEQSVKIEGVADTLYSTGLPDIMFTKYDANGNMIWNKHYGSTGDDNVFDADCDSEGNIILSGYFEGTVTFDTITLTSWGQTDMMVLKFGTDGNIIWAKQMGGSSEDGGNEVSIGPNDRVIIGAQSKGTFTAGAFSFPNTGSQDAYLISMTSSGDVEWVRAVQGAGLARAKSIAIDAAGNAYFGGDFVSQNAFITPTDTIVFEYVALRDAYMSSWSPSGDLRWYKCWGGQGNDLCKGVATNNQLEVYLVGPMTQTADFDGQQLTSGGDDDLYVWKTDTDGNSIWLRQISSTNNITGGEVVTGPNGGVIGGIGFTDMATFDTNGGTESVQGSPTEIWPAFFQFNSDGSLNEVMLPDECYSGRFGELSLSGSTVYVDIEYNGEIDFSGNIIDTDELSNRDGAIVSLTLGGSLSATSLSSNSIKVRCYPNPTTSHIQVEGTKMDEVRIYDLKGLLVSTTSDVGSNSIKVELENLPNGTYILEVVTEFGTARKEIIKQ